MTPLNTILTVIVAGIGFGLLTIGGLLLVLGVWAFRHDEQITAIFAPCIGLACLGAGIAIAQSLFQP